jgi:hypothetical protein
MGAQYPQSGMGRKRVTLVDTDILIDAGRGNAHRESEH